MRPLSASSLKTYRRCPQKWKLKSVDELPEEDRSFFNLGRAVHAALEAFYDGRMATPALLGETLEHRTERDPSNDTDPTWMLPARVITRFDDEDLQVPDDER